MAQFHLLVKERLDGKGKPSYHVYSSANWLQNKNRYLMVRGDYRYREGSKEDIENYAKTTGKKTSFKSVEENKETKPSKEEGKKP